MILGADFFKDHAADLRWTDGMLALTVPTKEPENTELKLVTEDPEKENKYDRTHDSFQPERPAVDKA